MIRALVLVGVGLVVLAALGGYGVRAQEAAGLEARVTELEQDVAALREAALPPPVDAGFRPAGEILSAGAPVHQIRSPADRFGPVCLNSDPVAGTTGAIRPEPRNPHLRPVRRGTRPLEHARRPEARVDRRRVTGR